MASFRFDKFRGIRPRVTPRLLIKGEAQTAENCKLGSGALAPWGTTTNVLSDCGGDVISIFRMRNNGSAIWLQSVNDVEYARGPVPDDLLERIYYTGEAEPRFTFIGEVNNTNCPPDGGYRVLGIPAPASPATLSQITDPVLAITGTMTDDSMDSNKLNADFTIEDQLPNNMNSWWFGDDVGYEAPGVTREFQFDVNPGKKLLVTAVPDANTLTISDGEGGEYIAQGNDRDRVNAQNGITKFRTDDTVTGRDGYFRFYLPNGIDITVTSHGLQVGDIIQVTTVNSPITCQMTQGTGPNPLNGVCFGWESDNGAGYAATNTWKADPTSVSPDSFFISGARSYLLESVFVDTSGAASGATFTFTGGFTWNLIERDGAFFESTIEDVESRVYVYTYVSDIGEEGPPSNPTVEVQVQLGKQLTIDTFTAPPSTKQQIDDIRIYRSATGADVTEFQFVAEITVATGTYDDSLFAIDLGEILQTTTWDPPDANLEGIVALPNGVMAGFVGQTVHFSEPFFPHAWPTEYRQAVAHEIVALGILPSGVAVLTKGTPYAIVGDHPRAMSQTHYQFSQACANKRSVVSTIDSVLYASPDGLCSIGPAGFSIITRNYAKKTEWQTFNPATMLGFWHDNLYYGFHASGDAIIFDPNDESIGFTTNAQTITAGYLEPEDDTLYLAIGAAIESWDTNATKQVLTWKSGFLIAPHPLNLGAGRIVADSYPVTLDIWGDKGTKVVNALSVTSNEVFRLPAGYLSERFEIQVSNDDNITLAHFAETVEELLEG